MARAVKQLCDLSRVLFGDEDAAASGQESVSSQASSPVSWMTRRVSSLSIGSTTSLTAGSELSVLGQTVAQMASGFSNWSLREAENNSRDWPKFDGKVLNYHTWKKAWKKHHKDVYPNLTVDHLKRVLEEKCLPEEVKDRITFKETMEEVWEFLDLTFIRPNQYIVDLMKPIQGARELAQGDFRGLERHMEMLLHTFERAKGAGMLDLVLHVQTLQPMFEKWPQSEQIRWWRVASEVPPSEQPRRFMEFVKKQYPQVAMLAGQSALCKRADNGRQSGDDQKSKKKPAKVTVNAAQAAAPAAPARPQQQQPAQHQYQQQQQKHPEQIQFYH
jgi:hypothetical protein